MLSSTLILDDASGDDITFVSVHPAPQGGSRRRNVAASPGLMHDLLIRHTQKGSPQNGFVDTHNVQVLHDVTTPTGVKTLTVNFTINAPRDATVTQQMIHDDVAIVLDLLTDGALVTPMTATNLQSLIRGEA